MAFKTMIPAAIKVVMAKSSFKNLGLDFNAVFEPSIPPTAPAKASGNAVIKLKCPEIVWPRNPMNAVAETMMVEVPTAIFMGTLQARTINGTRKEPPDTPTIPAKKPDKIMAGSAILISIRKL